ncbi:AMP-binding protein [Mycobacterium sp. NBC_00419]|uniref:class I adenylate-forming enzyme family protein n=1 Tax=Mycobacterium sp. NBC_00419 TaxID=2975989 RepID=UPI002E2230D6
MKSDTEALPSAAGGYPGFLSAAAARWPNRVGLRFESAAWTYRELQNATESASEVLQSAGVGVGTRVLLLAENCPEYLIAQFALARLGAVFVTPNPYWTAGEVRHAVDASQASAVVHDAGRPIPERMSTAVDIATLVGGAVPQTPAPAVDHHAPLYIPFSSGTTGLPKGVVHTTASLCGGVEQLRHHTGLTERDRLQLALPLCHIFGATMAAAAINVGAELTLFRRFDLEESLEHIRSAGVTVWPMAGAVAHRLAGMEEPRREDFSSLRFFMWGGSAVPSGLAAELTERTGVPFLCSYGMTEAMMVAFNPVDDPTRWRLDSPGYPTLGTEIRVARSGELLVRGPSVAAGYAGLDSPDFDDGWFATGDIGRIDADGRLWIVDRLKDVLKVSGFQVAPTEVENALLAHPEVSDVGVIGVADPRTGETPVAYVVGSASAAALDDWLRPRLATYKRPTRYVFVDELPRTSGGKLRRAQLPR